MQNLNTVSLFPVLSVIPTGQDLSAGWVWLRTAVVLKPGLGS